MAIEYEKVRGFSGLAYVLEHEPEQWETLIAEQWYSWSWWRAMSVRILLISQLEFRRQVSSELPL